MTRKRKADPAKIGSKIAYRFTDKQALTYRNFNEYPSAVQCKICSSDYMRFAIDGHCQRCVQRVEFVIREHPHIAAIDEGGRSR